MVTLKTFQAPTQLKRQNASESSEINSFEETYKTAYSHGLEAIYKLEDIDVRSIRKIGDMHAVSKESVEEPLPIDHSFRENDAYEFDLGPFYRGYLESFILKEPIQVLCLSKHAEKCLIDQHKRLIRDLLAADFSELIFIRGMGQGHIDEIQHKLHKYIEGRNLKRASKVDFAAWIRSLTADLERKKLYVALEPFGLSELLSLTPAENIEVRRLTLEKKIEWREEAAAHFCMESKQASVQQDMFLMTEVFIKPWIKGRQGIALQNELLERLQQISERPRYTMPALEFFKVYYFRTFPLATYVPSLGTGLFAADQGTATAYQQIITKAHSYFYSLDLQYPFEYLVNLIEREFCKSWDSFPPGLIEKSLRSSPAFRVRKDFTGTLRIRLA